MCPCGEGLVGLDLSMLWRPEIRGLTVTVLAMLVMWLLFAAAKGRGQARRPQRTETLDRVPKRQPNVSDIVQQIADDNARLRKELERQKPRWRF
jgi:hypothetical protein